jgi:hypothetical protein
VPWSVEDHLAGKPAPSVDLFRAFTRLLDGCGPYETVAQKTTVTFKGSRRGFAGCRPTATGVTGFLDLRRPVEDPRVTAATPYTKRLYVNHFRLTEPAQLDGTFRGWLAEAYAVGQGAHL